MWRDITTYSKHEDRAKTEPRAWELRIGDVRLVVANNACWPETLIMYCPSVIELMRNVPLGTLDVEEGKRRACALLSKELERIAGKYNDLAWKLRDVSEGKKLDVKPKGERRPGPKGKRS